MNTKKALPSKSWPKHPFIYEINTWVWLQELSQVQGRSITLVNVPGETWDALAGYVENLGQGAATDPLFRDVDGAPLTVEQAYEMLLAHAAQTGMGEGELLRLL